MISFPNFKNLFNVFSSKFKEKKPEIDPTVEGSWSFSFGQSVAAVGFAFVILIKQLLKQFFPQTATGDFLSLWGSYDDLTLLDPTSSIGSIAITGIDTTVITAGESWQGSTGIFYQNSVPATITALTIVIDALTSSGTVATAKTTSSHKLATGMTVVMSGASESQYNVSDAVIAVISETEFTYTIIATTSPATGSPIVDVTFASVTVQSTTNGAIANLNSGSILDYQGSIVGVDSTGIADFLGLQGGADIEEQEAFRARILLSRASQEGVFTNTQIELAALSVSGNTRVYIQNPNSDDLEATDPILPGQVRIYILRDDDDPITPLDPTLTLTKKAIIEQGKLPANQWTDDVFVLAPTLLPIDFDFSVLDPDTGTMRIAIENQIKAYFTDEAPFGEDIDEDVLRGVIIQTQDLTTGDFIVSFDFSTTPAVVSGVIPVESNELPVLEDITWSV